ncbi:MAG: NFACT family protein [Synechococcales cyanobacterium C42_A2020_086]|jgi:predicted ribosome quality control (RQC) complex YloA/Tae2 family protein|nr:NFACT family protein [Synechococcales cyanobacterium C42_A2020_086]
MQPVDFTTLTAVCAELRADWLPARLEQVYQRDRYTLALALRTLDQRGWLTLSWHPQAARMGIEDPPPRTPDTFTFSEQLRHQLNGLALVALDPVAPWERVIDLQFARRPGEAALWHLYVEIMGNYSNVILTNQENSIVTAAHQVSVQQSSVRPIQTGQPYELPPRLTGAVPSLDESIERWQERLSLIPGALKPTLLKTYRGLSSALVVSMIQAAGLHPDQSTDRLTDVEWRQLFECWQEWLRQLAEERFQPGWLPQGYTVMGWGAIRPEKTVQALLHRYYRDQLNQQEFSQLRHQISQKLTTLLKKLDQKAQEFRQRLSQADQADRYREQADLLMAYLHKWQPGLTSLTLADFTTGEPVVIPLDPEKNAVQNAQALYKRHQKLKRSRAALEPLLAEVEAERRYLEQVEVALAQLDHYGTPEDLDSLAEIRDELIQQGYLSDPDQRYRSMPATSTAFLRYRTPSGFEVLIGRNNRQNDQLTFRLASDYDLWFHTQEIPGSHVLLRLEPGAVAEESDLQFTADLAAYYSRARHSDQAPVVYTEPKQVFKPKGAKPGMALYKQERVIWGEPQRGSTYAPVTEL